MYAGLRHIFRNLTLLYVPKWQNTFDTLYDFSYNHTFSVTNNALNISENGFYATSSFYFVTPQFNRNDDFRYSGYTFLIDRDFVKNKNTNPSFLFLNSTTSTTYNLSDVRYSSNTYNFRVQNNNITVDEDRLTDGWWSVSYDFQGVAKLNTIHTYAITSNAGTFYNFTRLRFINRTQSNYNIIRSVAFFKECLSEEQTLEFEQFIENQKDSKIYNDMPLFVSTYIPEIISENISYNSEIIEVAPQDKGKMCSYAVKNQTLTYGGESLSTEELPKNISLRIFDEYFKGNNISTTFDSTLNDIVKQQFQYVLSKFRLSQNPQALFPHLDFLICPAMQGIVDSDLDTKSNVHYTNTRSCINGYDVIKNLITDSDKQFTYYYQSTYARYLHAGKRMLHLDDYQNITYDIDDLTIDDAIWSNWPYCGFGCKSYSPGWSYCVSVLVYRTAYHDVENNYWLSGFELQQNMQGWAYTLQHCIFGQRYSNGLAFNRDGGSLGYQSYTIPQTENYEGWWVITFNIDGSTDGSKWGRTKIFSAQISAPSGVVARGVSNNQWVDARTAYAFSNWAEQVNIVFRMVRPQSAALKMLAIQNTTLSDDEFSEFNHYMIDYALTCPEINGNQLFREKQMVVADSSLLSFI